MPQRDARYRIGLEYTGAASGRPQWVLRFCDGWVSAHRFKRQAIAARVEHNRLRIYAAAA